MRSAWLEALETVFPRVRREDLRRYISLPTHMKGTCPSGVSSSIARCQNQSPTSLTPKKSRVGKRTHKTAQGEKIILRDDDHISLHMVRQQGDPAAHGELLDEDGNYAFSYNKPDPEYEIWLEAKRKGQEDLPLGDVGGEDIIYY